MRTPLGSCSVRAIGVCGNTLWSAERSGKIVVRNAESGEETSSAHLPDGVFGNCFEHLAGRMWLGCTDGTVRSYPATAGGAAASAGRALDVQDALELPSSAKHKVAVTALCAVSRCLYAACSNGAVLKYAAPAPFATLRERSSPRRGTYGAEGGETLRVVHTPASDSANAASEVTHLASRPGVLYAAYETGHLVCIPVDSSAGDDVLFAACTCRVHRCAISSVLWVGASDTLWVGGYDGRIVVLNARKSGLWEAPLATFTGHKDPLNARQDAQPVCLELAGQYVVSGGCNGALTLYDAAETAFLPPEHGKIGDVESPFTSRATGTVGGILKLHATSVCTAAKVWAYGGHENKTLALFTVPGFDEPVVKTHSEHDLATLDASFAYGSAAAAAYPSQAIAALHAQNHALEVRLCSARKQLEDSQRKVCELERAADKGAQAKARAAEMALKLEGASQVQEGQVYALEQKVRKLQAELEGEESLGDALRKKYDSTQDRTALAEERLRESETKRKSLETVLKLLKEEKATTTKENESLTQRVKNLEGRVSDKSTSAESFTKQLSDVKDEVLRKDVQLKKVELERKELERKMHDIKSASSRGESQTQLLNNQVKQLKQQLLVRTDEVSELLTSRDLYKTKLAKAAGDLEAAIRVIESEEDEKRQVADTAVLARNEAELLRRERDTLLHKSSTVRSTHITADTTVNRMKAQLTSLQDALGQERSNNKLLEDQYAVFQFVINSRGELVTSIWAFHDTLKKVRKELRTLEDFMRRAVSPNLKAGDRDQTATLSAAVTSTLTLLEEKSSYIVSNYFTEYEKLHFGISSYHYYPDSRRPQVVADTLTRLQDVTPAKQRRRSSQSPSPNHSQLYAPASPPKAASFSTRRASASRSPSPSVRSRATRSHSSF